MAAEDSAAGEAGLCVCTVSKDEMMAGVMYNRSVPFEYQVDGKSTKFSPPVRGLCRRNWLCCSCMGRAIRFISLVKWTALRGSGGRVRGGEWGCDE